MYYQNICIQLINVLGQFLDALLSIYFLHRFFCQGREDKKSIWLIATIGMTVLTQTVDCLFNNNTTVWMLLLFIVPFFYTVIFEKGNLAMKFWISALPCVILLSIESVGVSVIALVDNLIQMEVGLYIILYIFRRIILKTILLLALRFLLNYPIFDSYYGFRKYWYLLGMVSIIEWVVLYWFRGTKGGTDTQILHLIMNIFCLVIPLLFYYVIYQVNENLKKIQVMLNQKSYIDTQEQYMQQLISMQDSLKKFRHDYKTHLFCIDQLLAEKNYEEVHQYLQKIHDMGKNMALTVYTSDQRLNILLNQITQQAAKRGINLTISAMRASVEKIPLYDLNILLANLFNNAVEAAERTEEKKVEIRMEKNRAYLQIMVQNSVVGNPLRENPRLTTSKDDKDLHGFGMPIIQTIVEKYQGMLQMDSSEGIMKIDVLLLDE